MASNGLKITAWRVLITAIAGCFPVITRSDRAAARSKRPDVSDRMARRGTEKRRGRGARERRRETEWNKEKKKNRKEEEKSILVHDRDRDTRLHLPPIISPANYLAPISPPTHIPHGISVDRGNFNFVQIASMIDSLDRRCFRTSLISRAHASRRINEKWKRIVRNWITKLSRRVEPVKKEKKRKVYRR